MIQVSVRFALSDRSFEQVFAARQSPPSVNLLCRASWRPGFGTLLSFRRGAASGRILNNLCRQHSK